MTRTLPADKLHWLIVALPVVMMGLLGYLFTLEKEIDSFHTYDSKLQTMLLLDKHFDNFLLRKIEAQNYETINRRMERFEKELRGLQEETLDSKYGAQIKASMSRIEKAFHRKREHLERFKSHNAAALNSIHYIFDLRRTLSAEASLSPAFQAQLDTALFGLMQSILGIHLPTDEIRRTILRLREELLPIATRPLHHYLNHTLALTKAIARLNGTSLEGRKIPLASLILDTRTRLNRAYRQNIAIEKSIALLFFLLSFAMLFVIAYLNHRARKTHKKLQAFIYAVENSDNTIVMTDTQRKIVYVNEVFEKTSGYTREEAIGENPRILKSGIQDEHYYARMNETLDAGKKWEGLFINRRKEGTLFYEKASIVPILIDGELTNYLAIKLDITEYIEQEKRLKLSAAVFENAQESIFITDRENRIISVNRAFTEITGYTESEGLGQNPRILKSGKHDERYYRQMWRSIQEHGSWHGKIYNRTKSGEIIPGWLTISTLYDEKGEVLNYIGMLTDLREIIQSQERAEFLAYHDTLTGLPNRARFEEHLFHALEVTKRNGHPLAILFIDLDRFKLINDTLGHDIGDILLKKVSTRIRSLLRKSDMLARIGGDEFVAVLETIRSAGDVAHVCEKILQVTAKPIRIGSHSLHISTSIGVALAPENGTTLTELIKNADNAMYLAKSLGKNNFQFFMPELSRHMHRRLEIEQGLTEALEKREFHLVYQPQYRLQDRGLYGAEALLRWQSETLGNVPPDEFIPVAEETGKIDAIGKFVFEEACRTLARLDRESLRLQNISINVSSRQFTHKDLPAHFLETAHRYGISPERITLEMTERYIMDTSMYDDTILDAFRQHGFRISVDDFGTGYSSMSYLKKLPIDTIKIDKSFIQDTPHDLSDNEITKAIIALSASLGYKTVAEGIEKEEQERFLLEHDCHYGQGYLFSKPLEGEAFLLFVRRHTEKEFGKSVKLLKENGAKKGRPSPRRQPLRSGR